MKTLRVADHQCRLAFSTTFTSCGVSSLPTAPMMTTRIVSFGTPETTDLPWMRLGCRTRSRLVSLRCEDADGYVKPQLLIAILSSLRLALTAPARALLLRLWRAHPLPRRLDRVARKRAWTTYSTEARGSQRSRGQAACGRGQ